MASVVKVGEVVKKRCLYCRKETEQEVIGITSITAGGMTYRARCKECGKINTISS